MSTRAEGPFRKHPAVPSPSAGLRPWCNPPEANRIGTVGLPIPGVRVRIADDGEILVKGGNVCSGYFRDDAGTAALLDEDGWMHSGDAGSLDADGYLRRRARAGRSGSAGPHRRRPPPR